jgi:hypothetical protein
LASADTSFASIPNDDDLATLKQLAEAGELIPVIEGTYPLVRTPELISRVGEGHSRGKTIITVHHIGSNEHAE